MTINMEQEFQIVTEHNPPFYEEVVGYNERWIDPDFNQKGIRMCFRMNNDEWHSAAWWDYQDCYISKYTEDGNEPLPGTVGFIDNSKPTHFVSIPKSPSPLF